MARDKRTKPCGNCKRSKVKCEYNETLPCVRCVNTGLASSCLFLLKLPSLKLPLISTHHVRVPYDNAAPPLSLHPLHSATTHSIYVHNSTQPTVPQVPQVPNTALQYGQQVDPTQLTSFFNLERKVESMDSKFNELLKLLHENQTALKANRETYQPAQNQPLQNTETLPEYAAKRALKSDSEDEVESPAKKLRVSDDFRDDVISFNEARELFKFFDQNISQQLFGFELKNFRVDDLWFSSPILICAVCTIALIHYPEPSLSSKQPLLQQHLHRLCSEIIFDYNPKSDLQIFNTIVALVFCSFWLADSQRFTGLALQLAKEHKFNEVQPKSKKIGSVSQKDRLKLWYLIYVLDGQQSMTFHRQALVSQTDTAIQNSRQLLLNSSNETKLLEEPKNTEGSDKKQAQKDRKSSFTDLRLVSQVEYNCALEEALKGNAWDLINPSAFGIPSKSNLELDKWMVLWTVLLAPMNNGTVWLSKSTLIYYNFAKMHINSMALRSLQVGGEGSIVFPKWNKYKFLTSTEAPTTSDENIQVLINIQRDEDGEEFIANTSLASKDQAMLNLNIAIAAAQTVLSLVLNDSDILDNLKYVPVHIHVMLYYAAFLLVSAPANLLNGGQEDEAHFKTIFNHLKMIKTLQKKILQNLPTDKSFGEKLLQSLDTLFDERLVNLQKEVSAASLEIPIKAELINEMSMIQSTYSKVELIPDSADISSPDSSPQPEKIYAWPASHHGHV